LYANRSVAKLGMRMGNEYLPTRHVDQTRADKCQSNCGASKEGFIQE